VDWIFLAEGKI